MASRAAATGNHHSAPMGGRSALMGGTGVALGVDGAAPTLNPATITRIGPARLAFSSRFYRVSWETLSDFHQPGPADEERYGGVRFSDTSVTQEHAHGVPDSVCYFFPSIMAWDENQRLSLCLSKTEEQELSFRALGYRGSSGDWQLDQGQNFDVEWSRFQIGPAWAFAPTGRLSLGAALLVAFTRYSHSISGNSIVENVVTGDAAAASYESVVSAFSWDLAPRLGATYRFTENVTLGMSNTIPLLHLLGKAHATSLNELDGARVQWIGEGKFQATPPFELRLGVGVEWRLVRFEADAFLNAGSSSYAHGELDREQIGYEGGAVTARGQSSLTLRETSNPTLNLALGAEVFVGRRLSLLAGVQTDFNATKELDPTDSERLFRTRLDYYRVGAGLSSYTDFGDLMAGVRLHFGGGSAAPVNLLSVPLGLGRSDLSDVGLMLVLAGSINWQSISQAAGDFGDAVRGKAGPPPDKPIAPLRRPKSE